MNIRAGIFPCPGKGAAMEKQEMTIEELREYIKTLPDNVIVRGGACILTRQSPMLMQPSM